MWLFLFLKTEVAEVQEITEIVNTVGFPISCVIATGLFIWKTSQQTREDNLAREERTFNQMDKLTDTLDKATDTIDRINIRLDVIEEKIDELKEVR